MKKSKMLKRITAAVLSALVVGSTFVASPELSSSLGLSITADAAIANGTYRVGSRGTQVKYIQWDLNVLAYNAGKADGVYGNNTKNAVIRFQKAYGLTADGIAGKNTINKLNSVAKQLQKDLNSLGFNCGTADGILGTNSINAIKAFQRKYGLTVDGIAGKSTLNKIKSVKSGKTSSYSTSKNLKLNLTATINYANKYAYNRNPSYYYYNNNNCCNYVSQCLVAGGMPTNSKFKNGSSAFIYIPNFKSYMLNTYNVKYYSKPSASKISVGDVIMTNGGNHIMIVVKKSGNTIYANGNTNNRKGLAVSTSAISGVLKTSALFG